MNDVASQKELLGLAIIVWSSILALIAVFIRLASRGSRH
jgi:hypothetical protein